MLLGFCAVLELFFKKKYLLMCMSYLLASFFISFVSILGSFPLLVLINFHITNIFMRKEKTAILTPSPQPSITCAGVLDVKTVKHLGA